MKAIAEAMGEFDRELRLANASHADRAHLVDADLVQAADHLQVELEEICVATLEVGIWVEGNIRVPGSIV
jgi:hypothetical protein